MITSMKGQQMIQRITLMYAKSEVEQAIYEAIGSEWDDVDKLVDEILLQLFPQTATWGLIFWEKRVKLPTNLNEDLEKRRRKVIAKMQTKHPLTPERMANVLKNYTMTDIEIPEEGNNTFGVILKTKTEINSNLQELIKQINRLKSSHTSYNLAINYITELVIKRLSNSWFSEPIQTSCGTIDVSGNLIVATDGWSFKEDIVNILNRYFSEEFIVASEETYSTGQGYSITQYIYNLFNRFFSEPFLVCAEDTCSTEQGRSLISSISCKESSFLSSSLLSCSENLYSIGGELVYDA